MNQATLALSFDDQPHILQQVDQVRPPILRISHPGLVKENHNLIVAARNVPRARSLLYDLAHRGYYVWSVGADFTELIHHDEVPARWSKIRSGEYNWDPNGIAWQWEAPEAPVESMVVVFSAMPERGFMSSIDRYFERNFSSLLKFLPRNTGVLRVSDFGGVRGGFYLPTSDRPDAAHHVDSLIRREAERHGIPERRVVLYGSSKGGTGSLMHGLANGWHFLSIDPIVDDEHYENKYDDLHFTRGGPYSVRKASEIARIIKEFRENYAASDMALGTVICSERSELYPLIRETLAPLEDRILVLNSLNPKIASHPTVAPNSVNLQTMTLNQYVNGLYPGPGYKAVM